MMASQHVRDRAYKKRAAGRCEAAICLAQSSDSGRSLPSCSLLLLCCCYCSQLLQRCFLIDIFIFFWGARENLNLNTLVSVINIYERRRRRKWCLRFSCAAPCRSRREQTTLTASPVVWPRRQSASTSVIITTTRRMRSTVIINVTCNNSSSRSSRSIASAIGCLPSLLLLLLLLHLFLHLLHLHLHILLRSIFPMSCRKDQKHQTPPYRTG